MNHEISPNFMNQKYIYKHLFPITYLQFYIKSFTKIHQPPSSEETTLTLRFASSINLFYLCKEFINTVFANLSQAEACNTFMNSMKGRFHTPAKDIKFYVKQV